MFVARPERGRPARTVALERSTRFRKDPLRMTPNWHGVSSSHALPSAGAPR